MNTEQTISHLRMGRPVSPAIVKGILSDLFELTIYRKLYKDLRPVLAKAEMLLAKEEPTPKVKETRNGTNRTDGI